MKKKIVALAVVLVLIPSISLGWQGKIVAVEKADTFVVLKDGQTPVKVKLAGVRPSMGISQEKAILDSSNIVLMKDVDVRELSKSGDDIVGDITINGKSLVKDLIDAGAVESINAPAPEPAAPIELPTSTNKDIAEKDASSEEIIAELNARSSQPEPQPIQQHKPTPPVTKPTGQRPTSKVHYIQVQKPQTLGLWPARPAAVVSSVPAQTDTSQAVTSAASSSPSLAGTQQDGEKPKMMEPGDIAKKDYELAVQVNRETRRTKNTGFMVPKKKSETFAGASFGTQLKSKPSSTVPYSTFGGMGGASVRHFYPSGFGVGGDFTMSRSSGKSGTVGGSNSTNGTAYDYKSKSFDTYTATAALLYRFYTDPVWTPYVALHGGYSFFSYPNTLFSLSDGAPVVGGGAGVLYEFDSGFTIGTDVRYLKTLGTKSHDPDGFLDTTLNLGYTFN
ncbi:hypothetical protein [Maridesulfovibrio sp. FT414]|uniref:hypothetical protein n=1 Tax=Maridesulfovibrio sp. FT414 TaxID=2979469 RepID=UPI003D803272